MMKEIPTGSSVGEVARALLFLEVLMRLLNGLGAICLKGLKKVEEALALQLLVNNGIIMHNH